MIKIIKSGTRQTKTCLNCGCVFSFEDEDIRKEDIFGDPLHRGFRRTIKCPQCKTEIVLEVTR